MLPELPNAPASMKPLSVVLSSRSSRDTTQATATIANMVTAAAATMRRDTSSGSCVSSRPFSTSAGPKM